MGLPALRPLKRLDLVWFDLRAGLPCAAAILREELGGWQTARLLVRVAWRSVFDDPLRPVSAASWPPAQEPLVRHQLRPVLLLDDALRLDLGVEPTRAAALLARIIRMSGARFVALNVPELPRAQWRRASQEERAGFIARLSTRLFNAHVEDIQTDARGVSFRVTACRFVQLTHQLGRPHLAPMFCAADAQFFEAPDAPALHRPTTLAAGDACCTFALSYRDPDEAP